MRRWLWLNGLSLVMFAAFVTFLVLQSIAGWHVRNHQLAEYGHPTEGYWHYLNSSHLAAAVFENWTSEFLQMASYVVLTVYLIQRGSPESKPTHRRPRREDHPDSATPESPRLARSHPVLHAIYRNSLSIVLFGLFCLGFVGHLLTGTAEYNEARSLAGDAAPVTVLRFLRTAEFWFQSLQHWQSEFLALGALLVLSVVLRQGGSPQSKPVTAPHAHTGG